MVDEASGAEDGIRMVTDAIERGDPYEVILLDHMMPGMSGITAGAEICRLSQKFDTDVILTTSAGFGDISDLVERVGFTAALGKPIRPQILLRHLAAARGVELADLHPEIPVGHGLEEMSTTGGAGSAGARILLAEDHPVNQKVAMSLLLGMGHEVHIAQNGREALNMVRKDTYDLVLMDIHMPEMDGLEAMRRIRNLPGPVARTPIVALTANAMKGDRDHYINAGMDDYVPKPIDPDQLARVVAEKTGVIAVPKDPALCAPCKPEPVDDAVRADAEKLLDDLDDLMEG